MLEKTFFSSLERKTLEKRSRTGKNSGKRKSRTRRSKNELVKRLDAAYVFQKTKEPSGRFQLKLINLQESVEKTAKNQLNFMPSSRGSNSYGLYKKTFVEFQAEPMRIFWSIAHNLRKTVSMDYSSVNEGSMEKLPWSQHLQFGNEDLEKSWPSTLSSILRSRQTDWYNN